MRPRVHRFASRAAILALALSLVTSGPPLPAQAAPATQDVSNVVPFLGVLVGWSHRNRIYRDANGFIADRNRYYDALRDTARRQLADREIAGLRPSQVAAYTKLVALIEGNRQAEIAIAEARKREARDAFHKRIEGVVLQRLLGTEVIQRVFGALTRGVNTSQGLIDTAIDKLSGGGGGILAEVEKIRTIARDVEAVAGAIGGPSGSGLGRTAGRIATAIERPQQLITADLEQVKSEIGELGTAVDTLARIGRTPSAGAVVERMVLRPPGGSDDPSVEAVAILISKLSVGNGSLRDQAKAAIQAGFVARCTAIANAYRQSLARLEGGGGEPTAAQAAAPCRAINLDEFTRAAQLTGTPEDGETAEATATAAAAALPDDRCPLAGDGDFVIENLAVTSQSTTCEDSAYPFGMSVDPLLAYLAVAGRWVVVSDSPVGAIWEWEATQDLEGAIVDATAQVVGGELEIDVTVTVPPSGSSYTPLPTHGNGLALAALLPLVPLAVRITARKRRRLLMLGITALAFLLMAQSCSVYGSFTGEYRFPIPDDGFACEVAPDDPNLAVMPGSGGGVSMQISVADEGSVDSCTLSASVSGVGVLKRDGFYTEDTFEE